MALAAGVAGLIVATTPLWPSDGAAPPAVVARRLLRVH
jgi:hypothetical protein